MHSYRTTRRKFTSIWAASIGYLMAARVASSQATQATQAQQITDTHALLPVGPTRTIRSVREAARLARPGQIVEVDAGDYVADVAVWEHDNITVRATGGRVRLLAQGLSAEGKGIWVTRCERMVVEGFDFSGARAAGRNGAGIRLEKGSLKVRDCSFTDNEMGLLTSNDQTVVLEIEDSEFANNRRPDGHNHNLYAGSIARLSVVGSYFHHAHVGHLLKSRAKESYIYYSRLTDETGGTASYELEFPNGGFVFVIGNIIEQNASTENPVLISYGAEGYGWPRNEICLVNNTLVDKLPAGGQFLRVARGAQSVRVINNLLIGAGSLNETRPGDYRNNYDVTERDLSAAPGREYRLRQDSPLVGQAIDPGRSFAGDLLLPQREYVHPRRTRVLSDTPHDPGALQSKAAPRHQ
jgi:hypothetical protein